MIFLSLTFFCLYLLTCYLKLLVLIHVLKMIKEKILNLDSDHNVYFLNISKYIDVYFNMNNRNAS